MTHSKSAQANEKVDTVVQEYMDTLLADLFPTSDIDEAKTNTEDVAFTADVKRHEEVVNEPEPTLEPIQPVTQTPLKESVQPEVKVEAVPETLKVKEVAVVKETVETKVSETVFVEPEVIVDVPDKVQAQEIERVETEVAPVETKAQVEKLFPNAPDWAQQSFDVLLFDVCGLKLAVPMDALGRIIKSEKDLNQLIGRPSWFMGAYTEAEESLYVVDTAKYIMPEKGFDLSQDGYSYLIQLQRSKWTLACQNVHTTVRLEPDQVKWRSQKGKRQWLAGTVIEQMCALVHVDTLVDILEAEAS